MNRRIALATLAGGLWKAEDLRGRDKCAPQDYRPKTNCYSLQGATAPASLPPPASREERPLWTDILAAGRAGEIQKKLSTAYSQLPKDGLGSMDGQIWLHRYYCGGAPKTCFLPDQNVHRTSAFLPWHRAFLYFHERLLQHALGEDKFRLPVWDWDHSSEIPSIYDFVSVPGANCEYCTRPKLDIAVNLDSYLSSSSFSDFAGTSTIPGGATGSYHDRFHSKVPGFMSDIQLAALDPLFYGHHANIDRLWCAWSKAYEHSGFHEDWPTQPWTFFDWQLGLVQVNASQFLKIDTLGYCYKPAVFHPPFPFESVPLAAESKQMKLPMTPSIEAVLRAGGCLASELLDSAASMVSRVIPLPKLSISFRIGLELPMDTEQRTFPVLLKGKDCSGTLREIHLGDAIRLSRGHHAHESLFVGSAGVDALRMLVNGGASLFLKVGKKLRTPNVTRFYLLIPKLTGADPWKLLLGK